MLGWPLQRRCNGEKRLWGHAPLPSFPPHGSTEPRLPAGASDFLLREVCSASLMCDVSSKPGRVSHHLVQCSSRSPSSLPSGASLSGLFVLHPALCSEERRWSATQPQVPDSSVNASLSLNFSDIYISSTVFYTPELLFPSFDNFSFLLFSILLKTTLHLL